MSYGTCRFCSKLDQGLVHYGVRHYAHPKCYLDAGRRLDELHGWQVGTFPMRLLKERGLLDEAERLVSTNHYPTRRRSRAKPF